MELKKIYILITLIFLVACSNEETTLNNLSDNGEIAKEYVESLGYEVVAFEKEDVIRYTEQDMGLPPNKQFWSVQTIEPTNYLGKDLVRINLLVKNHPLANMYESDKTELSVVLWNKEVIGGTSFPHSKEPLLGGSYSLDGKNGEDVKVDYKHWSENWDKKYGANLFK